MDLRELIYLTHGRELNQAIQDVKNAEWKEMGEFDDIVDIASSSLITAILVDDAFNEYDEGDIQREVVDIICEGFHDI